MLSMNGKIMDATSNNNSSHKEISNGYNEQFSQSENTNGSPDHQNMSPMT